jgi:acetyl esterase/lipase
MRRHFALLCMFFTAAGLSACTPLKLLTANAVASFGHYTRLANLAYGPQQANRLDLYRPLHGDHHPIVVFFYGGGWNSGDKADFRFVGAALAEAGFVAVLPNYRRYPEAMFPSFMQDAAQAVAWTRTHAHEWGADPEDLFVIGHSAGAHIAVLLALDEHYLQQAGGSTRWLRGVVGLSGPYDFLPFREAYLNELFGPPENFPRSQPINYVRAAAPPLLLMHGLQDTRVQVGNTRSLTAAMQAVGGRVTALYFEGADHTDLVAAFSKIKRHHLPVLQDIQAFVRSGGGVR